MKDLQEIPKQLRKQLRSHPLTKERLERTIISLGLYGKVSGIIGPYIVANRDGRMIIRLRPRSFQKSVTEASVANRKNMAAANKFAMFLKTVKPVYELWGKDKSRGLNPFTQIIRFNKKQLVNNHPSANNIITPEGYSIFTENMVSVEKSGKIRISRKGSLQKNESLVIIISAYQPKLQGFDEFECIEINSSFRKAGEQLKLTSGQINILRNYSKFVIYSAIIRKTGKKFEWSNTCVTEGEFDFGAEYELAEAAGYGQILHLPLVLRTLISAVKPPG